MYREKLIFGVDCTRRAFSATCFSRRSKPAKVRRQHQTGIARTILAHLSSLNILLAEKPCADDSEPETLYDDDDHDVRGSETFPPNSPNFVIWPEPTTVSRTGSRPIEIQGARGGLASNCVASSILCASSHCPMGPLGSTRKSRQSPTTRLVDHQRECACTLLVLLRRFGLGMAIVNSRVLRRIRFRTCRGHAANTLWS